MDKKRIQASTDLVTSSFWWEIWRSGIAVIGAAPGLGREETRTVAGGGGARSPVPRRGVEVVRTIKIQVQSEVLVLEEVNGRTADRPVKLIASEDDFVGEDHVVRLRHGGGRAKDAHVRFDWLWKS